MLILPEADRTTGACALLRVQHATDAGDRRQRGSWSADTSRVEPDAPPFYAVRLKIPAQELARLGDNRLKSGMLAEAFIQTSSCTLLSFLLKPLTNQIAHVFREVMGRQLNNPVFIVGQPRQGEFVAVANRIAPSADW